MAKSHRRNGGKVLRPAGPVFNEHHARLTAVVKLIQSPGDSWEKLIIPRSYREQFAHIHTFLFVDDNADFNDPNEKPAKVYYSDRFPFNWALIELEDGSLWRSEYRVAPSYLATDLIDYETEDLESTKLREARAIIGPKVTMIHAIIKAGLNATKALQELKEEETIPIVWPGDYQ